VSRPLEERVLVLIAPAKDAELSRALPTQAGVHSEECRDLGHLCHALHEGAAAVLLSQEWLASPDLDCLLTVLDRQPAWSELPILILTGGAETLGADSEMHRLGNITLLERPLRMPTLVTAIQTALRSRRRQYQIREHLREREEAERALRDSEERLRFSLDAGRLGFWQHDLRTDELICSDLCKAHFGRSPEEPLTHDEVVATVHPDDRLRVQEAIRGAIRAKEGYVLEYRVLWPDGSVRWVMVRGHASYDAAGQPVRTFGVTLDVTERRDAEARQAEQAERLWLLSESAGHLLATDAPGNMVGELFERVRRYLSLDLYLNYMVDEAGRALRLVSHTGIPEALAEQISHLLFGEGLCGTVAASQASLTLSGIQSSTDSRAAVMKALGMRAYTCHPLMVGDRLLGTLAFAVRDQDRFSEDQVEFLRTISHYVAVAMERARVEESLRDTARRKDEFLAMLAHELRNPLSPMANAIEIMRARPGRRHGERAREVLDRQLRHMTRLIDDLLDVSRINTGKITLKKERLDLVEAVQRALESVRSLLASCGHTLEADLPEIPVYVDMDSVRLEQVVTNLLNNAAKYTEPGGQIWVTLDTDGGSARLRVQDTGIGIPPDLLGRVFDLFTQGERSLDRSQGGLGLGLTLVRSLVRLHGGTVEAFSDGPGCGSEFVVTLPLAAAAAPASAPSVPPAIAIDTAALPTNGRGPRRLLVVDDNRDAAETLAELAQIWGFEVETAYDGLAALQRASEWEPALVFLDIGMPGLDGYEVARRLRQERRFENTTLVALTGYGQEGDRERSRAAGFDHHLVKPVDVGELERLLRSTSRSVGGDA
jgi:PAS domain S-box-containing protein